MQFRFSSIEPYGLKKKKSTDHQIVYPPNKLHILEIGFKLRFSSLRQFFRTHKSINFNEKKNKTKIIKVPISPNLFHLMQMSSDFECIHSVSFSLFLDTQMSLGNGRMESVSCRYFFLFTHIFVVRPIQRAIVWLFVFKFMQKIASIMIIHIKFAGFISKRNSSFPLRFFYLFEQENYA